VSTTPQLFLLDSSPPAICYAGKAVPAEQAQLAEQALQLFNDYTGSRLRARKGNGQASESLKRIIGALKAYPDIPLEGWRAAIEAALEDPWWSGRMSVGCVFGPNVVERNLFSTKVESPEQKRQREKFERRARGREALRRFKHGGDDLLPAS